MYRKTDLAEIVRNPSALTLKYLSLWFSGKGAYGKAMSLLGWPVNQVDLPLLDWNKKEGLRVNLSAEEKILYSHTILRYHPSKESVKLSINFKMLISPIKLLNTFKAIWSQSRLLVNYQKTYDLAKSYVESIPLKPGESLQELEHLLNDIVWPKVIAVDYIGEYIHAVMLNNLQPPAKLNVINKIHARVRSIDWYTQAMMAWSNYQEGVLTKAELVRDFGFAAGDDFELTSPRYYEKVKMPKPVISDLPVKSLEIKTIEDLAVGMHYLRSEAKRRNLIWIAALREKLR